MPRAQLAGAMTTDKQLGERIEQQIGWWSLFWEYGPGDSCGAAFETNYLVDQAGSYRGVRLRMNQEPPHVWVDTLTGRAEASDGEHTYAETIDDLLSEGADTIIWWLSTLWVTAPRLVSHHVV